MKKIRKEIIIATSIISLVILGVGFLNYHYKMETLKQKKEEATERKQELLKKETNLTYCGKQAFKNYTETWQRECLRFRLPKDCVLPLYLSDRLDKSYKESLDNCIKIYQEINN